MRTKQPLTVGELAEIGMSDGFKYNAKTGELIWR